MRLLLNRADALELVADAEGGLPELVEACKPGGAGAVEALIARGILIFGDTGRDGRQWMALTAEYVDALSEFPADALRKALSDYRNDPASKFYPLPGELRGRAKAHAEKLYLARHRCWLLTEKKLEAKKPPDDPEERARQIALTDEFLAKHRQKSDEAFRPIKPLPPPPSTQGTPAPGYHMTQAMVDNFRRRGIEPPATRRDEPEVEDNGAPLAEPTDEELAERFPF